MITKPKGCYDIYGKEGKYFQKINEVVDMLALVYHYQYIRTPIFESSELFHRGMGETSDVVKKEMYDFKDKGDRNLTLRPEGTAGVVRAYIENKMYGDAVQPVKFYYNGTMYRYERPQLGRDRELTQFGLEILGTNDPISDAEIISFGYQVYQILGLKNVKVQLNSLGDKESRLKYREELIHYLKPHIGQFCEDCQERLKENPLRILDCKVDKDNPILKQVPKTLDYLNEESKKHFESVKEYLDLLSIPYEVDPTIVRGLDYYSHTVFEFTCEIDGKSLAIGGGGRYNGLVELLGGPSTPCIGFASGVDRVALAMQQEGISLEDDRIDAFLLYVNDEEKKYAVYLAQELRLAGFRVETEYLGRSLKAQFKQADRFRASFLIILNSEELDNNEVKVKNNHTKEEEMVSINMLIYYLDEQLSLLQEECGCDCCHDKGEENE